MAFEYTVKKMEDGQRILMTLNGMLDESAKLPTEIDLSGVKFFYIDFSNLQFVNSSGIGHWIPFMVFLEKKEDLNVIFANCGKIVIDQVNAVRGFLPTNGKVASFFVPIYCTVCEKSMKVFQEVAKFSRNESDIIAHVKDVECNSFPGCRKNFEVDVMPQGYFKFLDRS